MTPAEFRRLALSFPGAEEREHMNHPDFRVGGRIFATLGYPDEGFGMVKLFPDQQADFVAGDTGTFKPVNGAWGRKGGTLVCLKAASQDRVRAALMVAWQNTAPKALNGDAALVSVRQPSSGKKGFGRKPAQREAKKASRG
jgi:hypothetical protein